MSVSAERADARLTAGPAASSVPTDRHGEPPIVRRSTAFKLLRTAAGDPLQTICADRLCTQVADSRKSREDAPSGA